VTEIIIETGILIPPKKRATNTGEVQALTALAQANIGDSIYLESDLGARSRIAEKYNIKFTVRKEGEGYRIWRTE
jgi:hypothetical protein